MQDISWARTQYFELIPRSKSEVCSMTFFENSRELRKVQIFGYEFYREHKWAKLMVQYGRAQSFVLSEICTVILWQDRCGKGNSRKFYLTYGWEKVPRYGNRLFSKPRKRTLISSVFVDDSKTGWKETEYCSQSGKYSWQRRWFGRANIIPRIHVLFGWALTENARTSTKIRVTKGYRDMFESQDLRRSNRKVTLFRKTWLNHDLYMVLWYAKVMQRNAWIGWLRAG